MYIHVCQKQKKVTGPRELIFSFVITFTGETGEIIIAAVFRVFKRIRYRINTIGVTKKHELRV